MKLVTWRTSRGGPRGEGLTGAARRRVAAEVESAATMEARRSSLDDQLIGRGALVEVGDARRGILWRRRALDGAAIDGAETGGARRRGKSNAGLTSSEKTIERDVRKMLQHVAHMIERDRDLYAHRRWRNRARRQRSSAMAQMEKFFDCSRFKEWMKVRFARRAKGPQGASIGVLGSSSSGQVWWLAVESRVSNNGGGVWLLGDGREEEEDGVTEGKVDAIEGDGFMALRPILRRRHETWVRWRPCVACASTERGRG